MSGVFNVLSYGAVGDGTTDDTAAINSAITAAGGGGTGGGGAVYLPWTSGGYLINTLGPRGLPLTSNLRVFGDGPTTILNGSATDDVFQVNGPYGNIEIDHLRVRMSGTVAATGGWFLNLTASGALWINVHDVVCDAHTVGATTYGLWGGVGSTFSSSNPNLAINNVLVNNCFFNHMGGRAIQMQCGIDWYVSNSLLSMSNQSSGYGILIDSNTQGFYGNKLIVELGQASVQVQNSIAGGTRPLHSFFSNISADGGGVAAWNLVSLSDFYFTDCWGATQYPGGYGVSTGSVVDNMTWQGGSVLNCARAGFQLNNGGNGIAVRGCKVQNNSQDSVDGYDGIVVGSVSNLIISDCFIGNQQYPTFRKQQRYGINIGSGANYFNIHDNNCLTNISGGILNGAGTGTSKLLTNNFM